MPAWVRVLWRIAERTKAAWEWWGILALLVPGIPVFLGIFEGQPWSVLSLYGLFALGLWIVLLAEGPAVIENYRRRRRPVHIETDECCMSGDGTDTFVGIKNMSQSTIESVSVFADLVGTGVRGRILQWVGERPNRPIDLDPGEPHHHAQLTTLDFQHAYLSSAYGNHPLRAGDNEVILYVKGKNLNAMPVRLLVSVVPSPSQDPTVRVSVLSITE